MAAYDSLRHEQQHPEAVEPDSLGPEPVASAATNLVDTLNAQ